MSQAELLAAVVAILNELQIAHMLVGSHASSFYGEARSTHDIDLVIDLDAAKIPELVQRFDPSRYYLSEAALREGRMANIIDTQTGDKVDCFILNDDPAARTAFSRRKTEEVMGVQIDLASAEDTIIAKLRWSEMIGDSTQQLSDVREIIRAQGDRLDHGYLQQQAKELNLHQQLDGLIHGLESNEDLT